MNNSRPYSIPSTSALVAFETAARHGNITMAAKELCTSQPTISRYIVAIEKRLSSRLFERSRDGVRLTNAGQRYRNAIVLGALRAGASDIAEHSADRLLEVSIACSPEVWHLFVKPRYHALRATLGNNTRVRNIACSHNRVGYLEVQPDADVILTWDSPEVPPHDRVVVAAEALGPFCSTSYAVAHAETLSGPVAGWSGLTFLDSAQPGETRVSWLRWFRALGHPLSEPRYQDHDNHLLALEAAVAHRGLVLGWRHLMQQYVQSGALIGAGGGFVQTGRRFHAVLTPKGHHRQFARACLACFHRLA